MDNEKYKSDLLVFERFATSNTYSKIVKESIFNLLNSLYYNEFATQLDIENLRKAIDIVDTITENTSRPKALDFFYKDSGIHKDDQIRQRAILLYRDNSKLSAVKLIKDHFGWGLKESKEYCDNLPLS